jgi:2-oxoglutarate dehydrogenase complex dehydrogenase (E1) component-like enzyme
MNDLQQQVGSLSLEFVEGMLADYLRDPASVSPDWRSYFDEMTHGTSGMIVAHTGNGHANGNGATRNYGGDGAAVERRQARHPGLVDADPGVVVERRPHVVFERGVRAAAEEPAMRAGEDDRLLMLRRHQRG